jgi:hypothetical protein
MTKRQRISLMAELWPNACQVQGWTEGDRELRLHVCSIAIACDIRNIQQFRAALFSDAPLVSVLKTTNDIDDDKEFTRVKGLLLMLADDLQGAHEVDNPHVNKARQMLHVINELVTCIGFYHDNASAYVRQICRDKFNQPDLASLSAEPVVLRDGRRIPSQLQQLIITLTSRLHNKRSGFRVLAGDSDHDMRIKAKLKCACKDCSAALKQPEPEPVGTTAGDPDWNV